MMKQQRLFLKKAPKKLKPKLHKRGAQSNRFLFEARRQQAQGARVGEQPAAQGQGQAASANTLQSPKAKGVWTSA